MGEYTEEEVGMLVELVGGGDHLGEDVEERDGALLRVSELLLAEDAGE